MYQGLLASIVCLLLNYDVEIKIDFGNGMKSTNRIISIIQIQHWRRGSKIFQDDSDSFSSNATVPPEDGSNEYQCTLDSVDVKSQYLYCRYKYTEQHPKTGHATVSSGNRSLRIF